MELNALTRSKIEGRLGYRLYDCVWNRIARDYSDVYDPEQLEDIEEHAEDLQQFAEEVEQELEARPTTKPRRSMGRVRFLDESEPDLHSVLMAESFYLDSDSRAALHALSAYAALKADENPRVAEFRARALRVGYLSIEQATDLLYSHAARFLTLEQMQDFDVPLTGHKTALIGPYREVDREEYFDHTVSLKIDPPGISLMLRYTNVVDKSNDVEDLVRCQIEGGEAITPYKISLPPEEVPGSESGNHEVNCESSRRIGPVLISNFDTVNRPATVWPGSLVDEVHILAQELSESFMWPSRKTRGTVGIWWNVDAAALFVLTGIAPLVHPIKVGLARAEGSQDIPRHISFEVLPWIRPESVFESYKSLRRALNVKLRNQGGRKFDVVTFVLQRSESCDPDTMDFRQLRESWNIEFPEKKFKDTYSFSTHFKRGLQAVEQRYYL